MDFRYIFDKCKSHSKLEGFYIGVVDPLLHLAHFVDEEDAFPLTAGCGLHYPNVRFP